MVGYGSKVQARWLLRAGARRLFFSRALQETRVDYQVVCAPAQQRSPLHAASTPLSLVFLRRQPPLEWLVRTMYWMLR